MFAFRHFYFKGEAKKKRQPSSPLSLSDTDANDEHPTPQTFKEKRKKKERFFLDVSGSRSSPTSL